MTKVEVRVVGNEHAEGGEADLRSLLRWVDAEESLRHEVRGRLASGTTAPPGSMGTGFDVLELLIGSGLSTGALVVSVAQWRESRRNRPAITLRRGAVEVEIPANGVPADMVERIVTLLDREADGSSDDEQAS
ncbi:MULTISPECIES: effector-associated constant component EACC1 [Streptomyces]|uniref:effector-associated constant component EACC1 n=1 Tax=Streptomyces TaxID=1883 RepID=UPI000D454491|nr:hypothetical protein [Streptomyces sp. ZL-24]POG43333.1 hypothetical protein BV881_32455 [Streptomyces sp. ZL-24]